MGSDYYFPISERFCVSEAMNPRYPNIENPLSRKETLVLEILEAGMVSSCESLRLVGACL